MGEERITERTDAAGNVTERVVERETPGTTTVVERSGGGGGFFIGLVLLIAVGVAAFFLFNMNKEEARQTDAISDAAQGVGEGARKVGDAAEKAADKLTGE